MIDQSTILAGVTVADFSGTIPGPLLTQLLGQLGAEVHKIEAPGPGDPSRGFGFFDYLNSTKISHRIDLKSPDGLSVARGIVAAADVLVEGFRPGVMTRLGLGYEQLAADFPRLVYCSISGAGQSGPKSTEPGHDLSYLADAGVINRHRDSRGTIVDAPLPAPVADITAGLLATVGVLAALESRRSTGRGTHIDMSILDASLLLASTALADADRAGGVELPPGVEVPHYGVFETSDARAIALAIMPFEQHFWVAFCDAAGIGEPWSSMTGAERVRRAEELRHLLRDVVARDDFVTWNQRLTGANVAWAPVRTGAEVIAEFGAANLPGFACSDIPIGLNTRRSEREQE